MTPQKSYCPSCGARIFRSTKGESTADPYLGQVIDNTFEVESILGTGSMGIVYKARHRALDCHVALKILKHDLLTDRVVLARFQREAQAASKLSHPNVIRILHYGKTSLQAPYIAMECLEGMELGVLIPKQYPLDQRRVCSIALQTARALSAAHAANIVHRDLKPANIFVIQRSGIEMVKVLDFGIAKVSDIEGEGLTREGAMCGTPAFMSPEQVIGKQVTYASDLFSLGSVMYYMLTNRLPFQGDNMVDMARAILTDMPVSPSKARFDHYIDPHLDAICMKALEKDVSKRYQTALEMVADLEKAYNEIPTSNAAPKPKLVVGGDGSKVDPTGATQCMLTAYPEEEAEDPALDGGTIVEMPVMAAVDDSEVMDTTKSGIAGALDVFGQAVSEVLGRQPEEHKLAPTDKTVINTKSMSDSDLEDPEEAREQLLLHRKRLLLGMICIISILCVVVIVIMAFISSLRKESQEEEIPEEIAETSVASDAVVKATDESDEDPEASKDSPKDTENTVTAQSLEDTEEVEASQTRRLSELSKEHSQTGLIAGLAVGISDINPDDLSDAAQSDEGNGLAGEESDAEPPAPQPDTTAQPASPKPKAEPAPQNKANTAKKSQLPSASAKPSAASAKPSAASAKPSAASAKPSAASAKPSAASSNPNSMIVDFGDVSESKKEAEHKPKQSAVSKKIAEAEKYEKLGNQTRACDIYRALSGKKTGIAKSEKEFIQSKLRSCNRIQI